MKCPYNINSQGGLNVMLECSVNCTMWNFETNMCLFREQAIAIIENNKKLAEGK